MTDTHSPKVSVIISTYNRADLLPRAVNSVLSQTFQDYEIIIVDDCSTDHTQEVIRRFNDPRVRSIRHDRNQHQSTSINTGINHAEGKYIAFLDDDDELSPGSLAGRVSLMDASPPDVGMCYGPVRIFDDSTGLTTSIDRRQWFLPEVDMTTRCLALESPTSTQTIMVRANVVREVGGFDSRYTELNDMNFSCRVSQSYRIVEFPQVVAVQHISHGHARMTEEHTDLVGSVRRHIADFQDELSQRPEAYAAVLVRLAIRQMMLRQRTSALRTYWMAATIAGLCSSLTLRSISYFVRIFLWYASPFAGIRDTVRKFRNRMKAMFR